MGNTFDPFWNLVHKNPGDGCWPWLGCVGKKDGYGKYMGTVAHKWAWELQMGRKVTPGLQLDHLCRVKVCTRASHLEEVTHIENHKRRRQAFCKRGHEQTEANTYWCGPDKKRRRCRPCIPIQTTAWRLKDAARRKAAGL